MTFLALVDRLKGAKTGYIPMYSRAGTPCALALRCLAFALGCFHGFLVGGSQIFLALPTARSSKLRPKWTGLEHLDHLRNSLAPPPDHPENRPEADYYEGVVLPLNSNVGTNLHIFRTGRGQAPDFFRTFDW